MRGKILETLLRERKKMITPEQLRKWYLEAIGGLEEGSCPNKKPYEELTDEQKFKYKYIANKIYGEV